MQQDRPARWTRTDRRSTDVPVAKGHDRARPVREDKPLKSILKRPAPPPEESDTDLEESDEDVAPVISRTVKSRLAEDDAEIAALEKKLGLKGRRVTTPDEDGLDWLAGGLDGGESGEESVVKKRKRPEDDQWLQDKRMRASGSTAKRERRADNIEDEDMEAGADLGGLGLDDDDDNIENDDYGNDEEGELEIASDDGAEDLENPFSADEVDSDDSSVFDSTPRTRPAPQKRQRENPYAPPVTADAAVPEKYVPPSPRNVEVPGEDIKQLKRQIQGQLNRLSEDKFVSILQAIEQVYDRNPRQHVSSTLVDLLISLVSDPSILNESFLLLHAGFATALYRVVGTDFGTLLLEKLVESIDRSRDSRTEKGKQVLNMIGFLSNLYSLQMVGSALVFDYIRDFLSELSESNTELLLRIMRTAGTQLRQDDPTSLKDMVLLLMRAVAKVGEDQLSVRTKFMIETINNLKNNRMKTGVANSAMAAEHLVRIRKCLGTLNTRTIRASEPLRISLADIKDSDKKGKWWLVGASYHDPAKLANGQHQAARSTASAAAEDDAGYESENPGHVSLQKLARAQGMNTDIRRAIFIAMLSASDYRDAHLRIVKLHLKSKQEVEVPRVLLHCAGAEGVYNPYYTLIARRLCGEKRIQKAFQFALWDVLKRMRGTGDDFDATHDDDTPLGTNAIVNLAKLYGSLIADGRVAITVLKVLEFAFLQGQAKAFAEVLLTTVMLQGRKGGVEKFEEAVRHIFAQAAAAPGMVQGLRLFVETVVAEAEVVTGAKDGKAVRRGCSLAAETLAHAAAASLAEEDGDEDDTDDD